MIGPTSTRARAGLLLLAAAAVVAAPVSAGAQEAGAPPRPLPDPKPRAAEPAAKISKEIERALKVVMSTGGGTEGVSRRAVEEGKLADALRAWAAAAAPADPLRSVAWWRDRFATTLPDTQPRRRGLFKHKADFADDDGKTREYQYWLNVPQSYNPKSAALPLVVMLLPPGIDAAGKLIEQHHAALLKTHLMVGWTMDAGGAKGAPPFHRRNVWKALLPLLDDFRIDRDRMVVDGFGAAAPHAQALAAESIVQWQGVILRGPEVADPLAANFAIAPTLLLSAESPGTAAAAAEAAILKVAPSVERRTAADAAAHFASLAAGVDEWIAALGPRPLAGPSPTYTFHCATQDAHPFGIFVTPIEFVDSGPKLTARVGIAWDARHGTVSITAENVSMVEIRMNDDLLDLDHPVTVRVNGIEVERRRLERSADTMIQVARHPIFGRTFVLPAVMVVQIPEAARIPEEQRKAMDEAAKPRPAPTPAAEEPAAPVPPGDGAGPGPGDGGTPPPTNGGSAGAPDSPPGGATASLALACCGARDAACGWTCYWP